LFPKKTQQCLKWCGIMDHRETERLGKWMDKSTFKNFVRSNNKLISGKCFIVRRHQEKAWLSDIEKTFVWCSENTTAPWCKIMTGIYIFTAEKDAMMFKMVWV